MSDLASFLPPAQTGISTDPLHHVIAAGTAASPEETGLYPVGSSLSDTHILSGTDASGSSSPYAAVANGSYDYSRDASLKALEALMALHGTKPVTSLSPSGQVVENWTVPLPVAASGTTSATSLSASALQSTATQTTTLRVTHLSSPNPDIAQLDDATSLGPYDNYAPDPSGTVFQDVPSYSDPYNFGNVNFNGEGNTNDLGGSRDPAWVEPTLIHPPKEPTSDSGARADEVQDWFIKNADAIGINILGVPLSSDTVNGFRDWIHGEIKQHHRGNQEVISDVFHQLATTPMAASQLNNIYHDVLGHGIDANSLGNAVAQLSYGHLTLSTERQALAHSQAATDALDQVIRDVQERAPNDGDAVWIKAQEDQMGNGSTMLDKIRSDLIDYSGEDNNLNIYEQNLYGVNADSNTLNWLRSNLHAGQSLDQIRTLDAHSGRMRGALDQQTQDVQGRALKTDGSDDGWVSSNEDRLGSGAITYAGLRSETAHWSGERGNLSSGGVFILGAGETLTSDAWLSAQQNAIGAGQATFRSVFVAAQENGAGSQALTALYQDWGQQAPTGDGLASAANAMVSLNAAWRNVQGQNAAQLQQEAASYQAPSSMSFTDMVSALAGSPGQATGVEANMLVNPLLETTADPNDARGYLAAGGEQAGASAIDEASVLIALKQVQNENDQGCDPVQFRQGQSGGVIGNNDIKAANQSFGTVNGSDWKQIYKDQGIQWKSAGSNTTADQQGLPYEAWVQHRLNPGQDPNGVVWLQDQKANWKVFDHWDERSGIATSDKTLNLGADSYRNNPSAVEARVIASIDKMTGYDEDHSKTGDLEFNDARINHLALNLAVPWITDPGSMDPQTQAEWRALCRAYHKAPGMVAPSGKSLSFTINTVTS